MKKIFFISLFILLACVALVGIGLSLASRGGGLRPSDAATIFAGLLAFAIVWWQGSLIMQQMQLQAEQMQLQAIIDLDKEWNSREMLKKRSAAWDDQNAPDKYSIEGVLEFLEKVSTFEERGVISSELVWETFGWYATRYFYYSEDVIAKLRKEWTPPREDPTLYEDLEALYNKLMSLDVERRNGKKGKDSPKLEEKDVKKELDDTRDRFIDSERGLSR